MTMEDDYKDPLVVRGALRIKLGATATQCLAYVAAGGQKFSLPVQVIDIHAEVNELTMATLECVCVDVPEFQADKYSMRFKNPKTGKYENVRYMAFDSGTYLKFNGHYIEMGTE